MAQAKKRILVILNGPANCGKSSTAKAFISISSDGFLALSFERYVWSKLRSLKNPSLEDFRKVKKDFYVRILGVIKEKHLVVTHLCGNASLAEMKKAFRKLHCIAVRLSCSVDERDRRYQVKIQKDKERIRAPEVLEIEIPPSKIYDLDIDTTALKPTEVAKKILAELQSRKWI
ncbi:MAG: phosphotransferase-like protein, partial [Planctomycetota bacterium]|jgi:chloramphenicol 3-O-phosphotransferase